MNRASGRDVLEILLGRHGYLIRKPVLQHALADITSFPTRERRLLQTIIIQQQVRARIDLSAIFEVHQHGKGEVLIMKFIGQAACLLIDGGTKGYDPCLFRFARWGRVDDAVAEDLVSFCVPPVGIAHDLSIRQSHHVADAHLAAPAGIGAIDNDAARAADRQALIIVDSEIESKVPGERRGLQWYSGQEPFDTPVAYLTDILDVLSVPGGGAHGYFDNVIRRQFVVEAQVEAQPAPEELHDKSQFFFRNADGAQGGIRDQRQQVARGDISQGLAADGISLYAVANEALARLAPIHTTRVKQ